MPRPVSSDQCTPSCSLRAGAPRILAWQCSAVTAQWAAGGAPIAWALSPAPPPARRRWWMRPTRRRQTCAARALRSATWPPPPQALPPQLRSSSPASVVVRAAKLTGGSADNQVDGSQRGQTGREQPVEGPVGSCRGPPAGAGSRHSSSAEPQASGHGPPGPSSRAPPERRLSM